VYYRNRGPVSVAVSCGNPLVWARYLAESTDGCLADRPPDLPPTVAVGAKWTAGNYGLNARVQVFVMNKHNALDLPPTD
jgi:hypothetical protein